MNQARTIAALILTAAVAGAQEPPTTAPTQGETTPTQPAATQPAAASQPSSRADASRMYFKQVCEVLDKALTQPAAKAEPTFYTNAAHKITALPKDNVDEDVVAWGGTVALALTNAANGLQVGQQRGESRANSVAVPQASDARDPNREERARVDVQNAQQARRQGGLEERAAAGERVGNLLANLQDARTKMAADITTRYGPAKP